MVWWWVAWIFWLSAGFLAYELFSYSIKKYSFYAEVDALCDVLVAVNRLKEILLSGLVPSEKNWQDLLKLKAPWSQLLYEVCESLRASGASLMPTLRRVEALAMCQKNDLQTASVNGAQAFAQAVGCTILPFLLGVVLYVLLPCLQESWDVWMGCCMISWAFSCMGAWWIVRMGMSARWGGISFACRHWPLFIFCCIEMFYAAMRSALPADMAWAKAFEFASKLDQGFALLWGPTIWVQEEKKDHFSEGVLGVMQKFVCAAKKALLVSLMEGKPCTQRFEQLSESLKAELDTIIQKKLQQVALSSLKPLFLLIAPSILGLVAVVLLLVLSHETFF